MSLITEILLAGLLVIGGVFGLIGSYGLIKLQDGMQRLHAPTKGTTVGVGAALIASSLHTWATDGHFSMQEILIILFLFVTAPLTALFLSKIQLHLMADRSPLPPTDTDQPWATFDTDAPDTDTPPDQAETPGKPDSIS